MSPESATKKNRLYLALSVRMSTWAAEETKQEDSQKIVRPEQERSAGHEQHSAPPFAIDRACVPEPRARTPNQRQRIGTSAEHRPFRTGGRHQAKIPACRPARRPCHSLAAQAVSTDANRTNSSDGSRNASSDIPNSCTDSHGA